MRLCERLKKSTKSLHDQLDSQSGLSSILLRSSDLDRIMRTLKELMDIWQLHLNSPGWSNNKDNEVLLPFAFFLQSKLDHLRTDMKDHLFTLDVREGILLFPPIPMHEDTKRSTSYALGMGYVLAGSTLGGQIIGKRLKRDLDLNLSFYNKEANGSLWKSLVEHLDQQHHLAFEDIEAGALDTFKRFISVF